MTSRCLSLLPQAQTPQKTFISPYIPRVLYQLGIALVTVLLHPPQIQLKPRIQHLLFHRGPCPHHPLPKFLERTQNLLIQCLLSSSPQIKPVLGPMCTLPHHGTGLLHANAKERDTKHLQLGMRSNALQGTPLDIKLKITRIADDPRVISPVRKLDGDLELADISARKLLEDAVDEACWSELCVVTLLSRALFLHRWTVRALDDGQSHVEPEAVDRHDEIPCGERLEDAAMPGAGVSPSPARALAMVNDELGFEPELFETLCQEDAVGAKPGSE